MPLYLREADVEALLSPADASTPWRAALRGWRAASSRTSRATGSGSSDGLLHVMGAADLELGVSGLKTYVGFADGARFVVALFAADRPELLALIEADWLGRLRTGAASAVAAKHLARPGATQPRRDRLRPAGGEPGRMHPGRTALASTGSSSSAGTRSDARSSAVASGPSRPTTTERRPSRTSSSRSRRRRIRCFAENGSTPARSSAPRARTGFEARELDNAVVTRASFVCCDSKEQARLEAGDLAEPVERGVLDWLEVHELARGGRRPGSAAARTKTTSCSSRASVSRRRTWPWRSWSSTEPSSAASAPPCRGRT